MSRPAYDYSTRQGVQPIAWEDFHGLCKALAAAAARFQPELILPIGRGGYYPGVLLAHLLQVEIFPVRVTRRVNDVIRYAHPHWIIPPPGETAGRRVLIVDEICSSGETLTLVKAKAAALGAAQVKSAVLYAHSWGVDIPDYIGLVSDALILNPWDREVLRQGEFLFHPEYSQALAQQGVTITPELRIPTTEFKLAKG